MTIDVRFSRDPRVAQEIAESYLASDPVRNHILRTQASGRVSKPGNSRYWIAKRSDEIVGVLFNAEARYPAVVGVVDRDVADAMAQAANEGGHSLAGVWGSAEMAALFTGQWTEVTKSAAEPEQGMRLYEAVTPTHRGALQAGGTPRSATLGDRDMLIKWAKELMEEVGDELGDPEEMVDRRLRHGRFWIWDDNGPVSMALATSPLGGVARIGGVYAPPENRNRGYASAVVAALTQAVLDDGNRCVLFTELDNPTSNSIYRRIGYRAVDELLRYRFASEPGLAGSC